MRPLDRWRERARALKREVHALVLAFRHPQTPWYAKLWLLCVVGYAASPIDLTPDFVPVLGYVDDMILLPLGIWLALRMIPPPVISECRMKAADGAGDTGALGVVATTIIVLLWFVGIAAIAYALLPAVGWIGRGQSSPP